MMVTPVGQEMARGKHMREGYPEFFWNGVRPFAAPQLRYLELTQEGRQWIADFRSHLFEVEHDGIG